MTGSLQGEMTGDISQLLLGICGGALLTMAAAMLRAPRPAARWTGFIFFACSALFAVKLWNDETGVLPPELALAVGITAMTSVGWFWLMVMALFGDVERYRPVMFLAPAAMGLCGIANALRLQPFIPYLWVITSTFQITLAIWAIVIVMRGWRDDLVESRRRLRAPFMAAVAAYILSLNGFDALEMLGGTPDWYPTFNAALLATIVLAGAVVFLDPREEMFGTEAQPAGPKVPPRASPPVQQASAANGKANGNGGAQTPVLDRAAKADLDRLEALMSKDQVWKEEGLTIAGLALRAGVPETQLRRLINDRLGYRNFPSYVNAHRIAAAKARLADPNDSRVSISTIAYDIGFASLGPFNRAFKEALGISPSEWRRKALGEDSPIPENA
ncbi:MAG: helix-turn-helix domain-containing protein [Hyphomonadaceae bacterium]